MHNLLNQTFGRLIVIERIGSRTYGSKKLITWRCKCECGKIVEVPSTSLTCGNTKSCGCLQAENRSQLKHGMAGTRIYNIWCNMRQRCNDSNSPRFKDYGGRGISVCDKWQSFENFYDWAMNNGYDDTLTIDRIDVDGNYKPSNCRWVTNKEQSLNKQNAFKYNDIPLKEYLESIGRQNDYKAIWLRVKRYKWNIEDAINKPFKRR